MDEFGNPVVEYHHTTGPFLISVCPINGGCWLWNWDRYQTIGDAMDHAEFLTRQYARDGLQFYVITQDCAKAGKYRSLPKSQRQRLHPVA